MMKKLIIISLMLVFVVAVIIFIKPWKSASPEDVSIPESRGGEVELQEQDTVGDFNVVEDDEQFITYDNDELGITFEHPTYLVPEKQQDGAVALLMSGPTQRTETEFYDGISISFNVLNLEGIELKDFVSEERDFLLELWGGGLSELKEIRIDNFDGLTFDDEAGTYIYIDLENGEYLKISNMTRDPGNLGYTQVSQDIISSIEIK